MNGPYWLRRHDLRIWRWQCWQSVLFTDESRFSLYIGENSDDRIRVYRRKGERDTDACVIERDRYGGGSVMVWGGIVLGHKTPLIIMQGSVNAIRYRDDIILPVVATFMQRHNFMLKQDNTIPHVAQMCRDFVQGRNVDVLPCPSFWPDFHPIKQLSDVLVRRIPKCNNPPLYSICIGMAILLLIYLLSV